jgi:hypothetical protein
MSPEERGIEVADLIGVFNQDKSMFTAQYMIEDAYGEDFGDLWADATVYWTDTRCPKNGMYAVIYRGQCNYGRMWSCGEMYVALSNLDPERTAGSALNHEFGHCMYMKMDPHHTGCPDHSDIPFWDLIEESNNIAKERGW